MTVKKEEKRESASSWQQEAAVAYVGWEVRNRRSLNNNKEGRVANVRYFWGKTREKGEELMGGGGAMVHRGDAM